MYDSLYGECNLMSQRMICACLIAFSGFLRSAELLKIKRSDIIISTAYMEIFIESNVRKYGFHSLRSGGATAAANKGVKDRMFKRHGRWASEKAKDGYVKDSLEQ
ncbi:hypothetical protein MAR_022346, partial [Mya arenaria]